MPSPTNRPSKIFLALLPFVFLAIVIIFVVWAVLNKNNILDWWRLRGYHPPSIVSQLGTEDTMTAAAYRIFEVNHPNVESLSHFSVNCPNNGGEQTIVLGCYHSGENGIFLLNESDPLLNGVEQVTAAHEMLHAAYNQLSSKEKNYVDGLLLNYYNNDLKDPRIIQTIAAYKQTEPNAVVNEMHSVFGTEVANLPPALEKYYSRYFSDRQKITNYANEYQAAFTSRQASVASDDKQLMGDKSQIDSLESDISSKLSQINSLQGQLNSYKSANNLTAYNALVPQFNQNVDNYNSEVSQLKSMITAYNSLVNQRNSVALFVNNLYQELSGSQSSSL